MNADLTSDYAIELNGVGLEIPINTREIRTLKKALVRSFTGGNLSKTTSGSKIVALDSISVSIKHGERVALIGHNGAGKTTFLRVVSGIYQPSYGSLKLGCKVHPMIQKAFITGPDLSGYQAVMGYYLLMNGNTRGFREYAEEVIEFSELGDFIHLPLKGYSEGMSARLLFSLLTSVKHECLALDEGFGTGDARFFKRAQRRLEGFIGSAGTLLLASHSEELLNRFCTRGLVFREGRLVYDGEVDEALKFYNEEN